MVDEKVLDAEVKEQEERVEVVSIELGNYNIENIIVAEQLTEQADENEEPKLTRVSPKEGLMILDNRINLVIAWVRNSMFGTFLETAGDRLQKEVSVEDYEDFIGAVEIAFKVVNKYNKQKNQAKESEVEVN